MWSEEGFAGQKLGGEGVERPRARQGRHRRAGEVGGGGCGLGFHGQVVGEVWESRWQVLAAEPWEPALGRADPFIPTSRGDEADWPVWPHLLGRRGQRPGVPPFFPQR